MQLIPSINMLNEPGDRADIKLGLHEQRKMPALYLAANNGIGHHTDKGPFYRLIEGMVVIGKQQQNLLVQI